MSKRLAQMSEDSLETGGRSARKAVSEAGFGEALRAQLEERIASASFKSDNAAAFAQANLPTSAGKGTRDIAGARPWTGTETVEDAALRMLTDAHKPLRVPGGGRTRTRTIAPRAPTKIDTGRSTSKPSTGARLANARDRSSIYSTINQTMTESERERFRKEMKARFEPASRAVPATLQGLASLANERIEDAIARGQFKNLPRGQKIERDYNASSPFLDTTEYFMNKIIQKQDIVPPWIEKQQELVSTANKFRARLRNDWKRHAARVIASRGGSLESQLARAREYAAAEAVVNPVKRKQETINTVDEGGQMSQITLAGELKSAASEAGVLSSPSTEEKITITEMPVSDDGSPTTPASPETPNASITVTQTTPSATAAAPDVVNVIAQPFRDPSWLATESSYLNLAINNLNSLTRNYNLMAPNLAKKPYYNLERELRSCYADVAPQLVDAIRERALAPKVKVEIVGHRPGGVMEKFAGGKARVHDERTAKRYGFKEFWRDLFDNGK
ncbi:hypothetical protein W97_08364 [Coniosporium apollinis CBS 100218]|uniref:DnaJ homologue subfamily C member 28 conserved domain-containing protein n=1 Tax=Coniosporium apollinis (strain CBS 100218) TaxID=1168221 RepID=R7Z549_CONA1|nr:uncharacterized protein W97_08364 [Coniosporium apollinis CBS 100218]EON69051.1 hypothetical protein W97_08364 [Coniosporium apollinis CBS 100218]